MRVLVTGATGFAGTWLVQELRAAGHDVSPMPPSGELDIADATGVAGLVQDVAPDVIAHLAATSSSAAASADPSSAVRSVIGGTVAVTEAAARLRPRPGVLVVSSAEVYLPPADPSPAIDESFPIGSSRLYGILKIAQESVAMAAAARHGLPLVVARPFNHVGPGQRPVSAVASFAARIRAIRRGDSTVLQVGNLDVERDIGDVRDVVVAYRLLLEALGAGRLAEIPATFNVATGRGVTLRGVVEILCRLAGVDPDLLVDPELVRGDDPPRIVGDARALSDATGWAPTIPLERTLADVLDAPDDA